MEQLKWHTFRALLVGVMLYLELCNAKPPNILLIVADDYGWNDIGYHGSEIKTPTLDKLAAEGVKLENYYVQPICSPSRSQLLSGRYQIHTGLQHGVIRPLIDSYRFTAWGLQHGVIRPLQPNCLPVEMPTLADKLKSRGYATHMVGKWHIGMYKNECLPTNRGFDSFYGYLLGAEDYYQHNRCYMGACGLDLHDNLEPVTDVNGTYSTSLFSSRVEKIVHEHALHKSDQPLFMYMPFQAVHSPLEVPSKYTEQYTNINNKHRRTYAGMVGAMDEAILNITTAFQKNNIWDNTLMIFTTDNGGQVFAGGNNYPLKGMKATLWEGGVRGVGFVHGKMLGKTGVANNELIHISDWFPTLLTLAGGQTEGLNLDGYNAWNAISNGGASDRHELLHNIDPNQKPRGKAMYNDTFDTRVRAALRLDDWKILTGNPGVARAHHFKPPKSESEFLTNEACVDEYDEVDPYANCETENLWKEKLVEYYGCENDVKNNLNLEKNVWLYNIKTDPYEYHDVSEKYPSIVRKLLDRLAYYNSTAVPVRYPPVDRRLDPKFHGGVWGPIE